jgi:hypothetical protein
MTGDGSTYDVKILTMFMMIEYAIERLTGADYTFGNLRSAIRTLTTPKAFANSSPG